MAHQPSIISGGAGSFRSRAITLLSVLLCVASLPASLRSQYVSASPQEDRPGRLEARMLDLLNVDRAAASSLRETNGRAHPLQWDPRLAAAARAHSEDMARRGYFSHQGSDGTMPSTRVSRAGVQWRGTAENIAKTSDVFEAESLFMNEPKFQHNHRGNILNANYTNVGIGIVKGLDGYLYITQDFAELR